MYHDVTCSKNNFPLWLKTNNYKAPITTIVYVFRSLTLMSRPPVSMETLWKMRNISTRNLMRWVVFSRGGPRLSPRWKDQDQWSSSPVSYRVMKGQDNQHSSSPQWRSLPCAAASQRWFYL